MAPALRFALVVFALLAFACGRPAEPGPDGGIHSTDAAVAQDAGALDEDAGTREDAGAEADAGTFQDGGVPVDGGAPADGGVPVDGGVGAIPGLPTLQWKWVPFPEAKCRTGSSTGIGINLNPASTKLIIFLEGGGACFNANTCASNPGTYGQAEFGSSPGSGGVLSRTNPANPMRDWSFVFVPYCTGDVHAGTRTGQPPGVAQAQQYLGYRNIGLYLERLAPTFPALTEIVLTGTSAGGFGATANYVQVSNAFASVPVHLIDDAGPFMGDPPLAACLQNQWVALWGLGDSVLKDCGADCVNAAQPTLAYFKHIVKRYPTRKLGLVSSTGDGTIRGFFGFGAAACTSYTQVPVADFTAGLLALRTELASSSNFVTFYFSGTQHTSLISALDTRTVGASKLSDWVGAVVDGGTPGHVGP